MAVALSTRRRFTPRSTAGAARSVWPSPSCCRSFRSEAQPPDDETQAVLQTIENGSFLSTLAAPAHEPHVMPLCAALRRQSGRIQSHFAGIANDVVRVAAPAPDMHSSHVSAAAVVTPFSIMLHYAMRTRRPGFAMPPAPKGPLAGQLLGQIEHIERRFDPRLGAARQQALVLVGVRDTLTAPAESDVRTGQLAEHEIMASIETLRQKTSA